MVCTAADFALLELLPAVADEVAGVVCAAGGVLSSRPSNTTTITSPTTMTRLNAAMIAIRQRFFGGSG
ncbi:hypothetical protein GCM10010452_56230 [Crossiella cryophila]